MLASVGMRAMPWVAYPRDENGNVRREPLSFVVHCMDLGQAFPGRVAKGVARLRADDQEELAQTELLRDIFPFYPITLDPS